MVNQLVSEAKAETEDGSRRGIGDNKPPKLHELLASELADTYLLELEKANPIADRANAAPQKIESDADLKVWTSVYLDANQLYKSLDRGRLNEMKPLETVIKTVFKPTLDRLGRITDHARKLSDTYNRDKLAREREQREAEERKAREAADQARSDAQIAAEFGDTDAMLDHAQVAASSQAKAARLAAAAPKAADVARVRGDDGGGMSTATTEWKFEIADYALVDLNALRPFLEPKDIVKAVKKVVRIQKGATKIGGVRVFEDIATQFRN